MSAVRIIRGTAILPVDLEDQFFRAYGRDMKPQERLLFGLGPSAGEANIHGYERVSKAA
jgi:hypothetical protein